MNEGLEPSHGSDLDCENAPFFTEILIGIPHRHPDAQIIILNRGTDYIEYHKGRFNYEKNHRVP